MNVPLNIDWQQILLHLLNFSILTLGLYLLLFKPVQKFIKERNDYYLGLDKEAKEKLSQAEELKASYEQKLNSAEEEIEEVKARSAEEAKAAADEVIRKAKEESDKIIADARKAAELERTRILEEAQGEIVALAFEATEKLLAKSTSDTLDQFLYAVKEE